MEFELARTGKASLLVQGRLLASLFSTHSPVAAVRQYRLRLFATNAGAYLLHAALGDRDKKYLCLAFESLDGVAGFFAEPDNLFRGIGNRFLSMARSSEKAMAKLRSDSPDQSRSRAPFRPGMRETAPL